MSKIWENIELINDSGDTVKAVAPIIISASRATDIPAFFSKWLMHRIERGYVKWINPFNRTMPHYISFAKTRLFVFWSKNPRPLMDRLIELDELGYHYYFQFTLNDYVAEGFEPNVPDLMERIETFQELSTLIGKAKVIWRFDPLILGGNLTSDVLIDKINNIAERLLPYTNKLVFSYVDISDYSAVQKNMIKEISFFRNGNKPEDISHDKKIRIAEKLSENLLSWKKINQEFEIATCSEGIKLEEFGIKHNKCIDDELIVKLFPNDLELMKLLGYEENNTLFGLASKKLKDKGQRKECGCIISKDIGSYNTCNHLCTYCYANSSRKRVENNILKHENLSESII